MTNLRLLLVPVTGFLVSCAQLPPTRTEQPPPAPPPPAVAAERPPAAELATAPTPLTRDGQPVNWWFVFKFNAASFPACGAGTVSRSCTFGGSVQPYSQYSQQYVYASDAAPTLKKGSGCVGDTTADPLGATFDRIYNRSFHYVVWNDQFYDAPKIRGCSKSCSAPWGHSKGTLVWNDAGEGLVLQVTTPSWPAAASVNAPRSLDGNTLGCVQDNNVLVSQHFFALKLDRDDVVKVLRALQNASVVTDTTNAELVNNGGPPEIQSLVGGLGVKSTSTAYTFETLSTGVKLLSKPSSLHVPPWQFVSAVLDGASLRTATWWADPKIYTTTANGKIACWDSALANRPGRVEIATSGEWDGTAFGLEGGLGANFNHAKIGVSISNAKHLTIFGDMNQQGATSGSCASSQNGRGGLFFVIEDAALTKSITALIDGDTAPTKP
jgi:hypothetical protein